MRELSCVNKASSRDGGSQNQLRILVNCCVSNFLVILLQCLTVRNNLSHFCVLDHVNAVFMDFGKLIAAVYFI